jgi:hypothetical protein
MHSRLLKTLGCTHTHGEGWAGVQHQERVPHVYSPHPVMAQSVTRHLSLVTTHLIITSWT